VLSALSQNLGAEYTDVYVFSNAAVPETPNDKEKVEKVRGGLKEYSDCFRSYTVIYREINRGANENMLYGINRILGEYDRVVVLEDDIVTSPAFLAFMNQALDKYAEEKQIFSICGYNPTECTSSLPGDSFTYDVFRSWGWAIWRDRWEQFSFEKNLVNKVDTTKTRSECPLYITALREDIIYPPNTYSRFLDLKLFYHQAATKKTVLYSKKSLCDNIGMDGNGLTIEENRGYENGNFDLYYDNTAFNFSEIKLTKDSDPQYFFEFRKKTFIVDIFFEQHFNRERLYINLYYTLSKMQLKGGTTESFFAERGIKKIAVYGYGTAGQLLLELLEKSEIEVSYIIDRSDRISVEHIPVYKTVQKDISIDAIVVTALRDFLDIEEALYSKTEVQVFAMDDLICECLKHVL